MLSIKTIRQDEGSVECGLITLGMLYSYYNLNKNIDDLREEISTVEVGTFSPQLGLNLLKNGFEVEIITRNPLLVEKKDEDLSQKELLCVFEERINKYEKGTDNNIGLDYFIKFMQEGGKVKVKIPQIEDLKKELEVERPVITFLSNASLYKENIADKLKKPFTYTFHSVLVVGVGDKGITINDPYWGDEGGNQTYPVDEFFYAMHSSALGGTDNDCLITVKKISDSNS
ncbi:MAG TPA: C39 family peptidase [Patescibacteria group bacterium]|nr:C39 family peptidase [Patescibacteria group bacterium]